MPLGLRAARRVAAPKALVKGFGTPPMRTWCSPGGGVHHCCVHSVWLKAAWAVSSAAAWATTTSPLAHSPLTLPSPPLNPPSPDLPPLSVFLRPTSPLLLPPSSCLLPLSRYLFLASSAHPIISLPTMLHLFALSLPRGLLPRTCVGHDTLRASVRLAFDVPAVASKGGREGVVELTATPDVVASTMQPPSLPRRARPAPPVRRALGGQPPHSRPTPSTSAVC